MAELIRRLTWPHGLRCYLWVCRGHGHYPTYDEYRRTAGLEGKPPAD